jgi:hypothetical protein
MLRETKELDVFRVDIEAMGLVSLLVYYKQAELLGINQWWEPMRHAVQLQLMRIGAPADET